MCTVKKGEPFDCVLFQKTNLRSCFYVIHNMAVKWTLKMNMLDWTPLSPMSARLAGLRNPPHGWGCCLWTRVSRRVESSQRERASIPNYHGSKRVLYVNSYCTFFLIHYAFLCQKTSAQMPPSHVWQARHTEAKLGQMCRWACCRQKAHPDSSSPAAQTKETNSASLTMWVNRSCWAWGLTPCS